MSFMIKDAMLGLYHSTDEQYILIPYLLINAPCLFSALAGPSIPTFSVSLLKSHPPHSFISIPPPWFIPFQSKQYTLHNEWSAGIMYSLIR